MNRSRREPGIPRVHGVEGDDRNRTGASFPSSLDPVGVSAAAKAVDRTLDDDAIAETAVRAYLALAGSPADERVHAADDGWPLPPAASPADERLREALERANDDLILIADESPEGVGESIDSVRAAIKDALAAADREKPEE